MADIRILAPAAARELQSRGARLIDVREAHERTSGCAEGAIGIAHKELLADAAAHLPDRDASVVLICQSGMRSLQAARTLQELGYSDVASVEGGTSRWRADAMPLSMDESDGDADFADRYARHLSLADVGVSGQKALEASRVLLVGAGGLGSPIAYYLTAAGVGTLRIVDFDVVDRSNLQRQIVHTEARIGMAKVESARIALEALNPRVRVEAMEARVAADTIDALLDGIDVAIDGADNFDVRYVLNDACVRRGVPMVHGAVHRFEGQVSVFDAGRQRGRAPCYRCLFPEAPPREFAPNCSDVGVLGVLPGLIGLVQATETLKLLLGIGTSLAGRLLHVDALTMRFRETRLAPDPACPVCTPDTPAAGYNSDRAR